jgi:hypothetical protein
MDSKYGRMGRHHSSRGVRDSTVGRRLLGEWWAEGVGGLGGRWTLGDERVLRRRRRRIVLCCRGGGKLRAASQNQAHRPRTKPRPYTHLQRASRSFYHIHYTFLPRTSWTEVLHLLFDYCVLSILLSRLLSF